MTWQLLTLTSRIPFARACLVGAAGIVAVSCSDGGPKPAPAVVAGTERPWYQVGPGDVLDVFVWRSEELSRKVTVRPDGRFSFPLVGDIEATGRTPTELGLEIETKLRPVIIEPVVTVMVADFSGTFAQQIRVIGEAQKPQAIPYRDKMTVLDAMIAVGGLTELASGNRAVIARTVSGRQQEYRVKLDDLVRDGNINANVDLLPGDILIIPQRYL